MQKKAFDKIQHPFMVKDVNVVSTEWTYLNIVETIYDEPIASIVLKAEKISSEIHDSFRTGPTVLLLWCQGTVMPVLLCSFISGAKRCVCEKQALRLTEQIFLCQARMLLLQKTIWMHGSVYTPRPLFFPFYTRMPKVLTPA